MFDGYLVNAFVRATDRAGVIVNAHTLGREQTMRVVRVLSRWFTFISLDELPSWLEAPRRVPFCLLTFDDGKKSNATVTAPTLRRLGVPAVFYVVTGFLSGDGPLWFDSYRALERSPGGPPVGLERDCVKWLPHDVRAARIRREVEHHGVQLPDSDDVRAMSWDDARRLAADGFTIGAHGVSHAILTVETRDRARDEIRASIDDVARELGEPCRTFAFPNGNHDPELCRYAVASGATTVMTTEPTWVYRRSPLWRLPRVQVYASSTSGHIWLKIALATVPGILEDPDGTGRAYRRVSRQADATG